MVINNTNENDLNKYLELDRLVLIIEDYINKNKFRR